MKKLTREEMKNLFGGSDETEEVGGEVGECATKKCLDYVNNNWCGGNTDCQCQSASTHCKRK